MGWLIGIDEAGYGPNLGPFVMTAVACRVPDEHQAGNLWDVLRPAVRRGEVSSAEPNDERLLVDDSKVVYSTARGLFGLERGVLSTLWRARPGFPESLTNLVEWACPDEQADLAAEAWYRGTQVLPVRAEAAELATCQERFDQACSMAGVSDWRVRSVLLCPSRFNALLNGGEKKGAVLAHGLARLLCWKRRDLPGWERLSFFIDKHGGRNAYAALVQHALPDGLVWASEESAGRSAYRVTGLGREVELTFQPRADRDHFCVALASMASKYLRELLMLEFNRFWQDQVPGLKATAGYPGDAARFFETIRPTAARLGIAENTLWRCK
jgi:hypothetical protein